MASKQYLVVVERAASNFSAYSPDLPGCIAVGDSREETLARMREAIAFHLDGLREDGATAPEPLATAEYVAA